MSKLDLRKELKQYYTAKKKPEILDVPPGKFLTYLGRGAPEGARAQRVGWIGVKSRFSKSSLGEPTSFTFPQDDGR